MRKKLHRALAGVAAVAAASTSLLVAGNASALPAATPPDGPVTMTPTSGSVLNDSINISPGVANCPGDSASDGYRWQMFISDAANDPATFTYTGISGPEVPGGSVGFTNSLLSIFSTPVVAKNTAPDSGQIIGIPIVSLEYFVGFGLDDGPYNVGFACTLNGVTEAFWSAPMTIANGGTTYAYGAAPAAPSDLVVTANDGQLTVSFNGVASTPATDDFTVSATPQGGGAAVIVTATSSPAVISGLTNGTTYDVEVVANNSAGSSPAATGASGTPQASPPQNVAGAPTGNAGEALVTFAAPTSGTPTGYVVSLTPSDAPDVNVAPGDPLEAVFAGLTAGTQYTATVTADLGGGQTSFATSTTFTVNNAQVLLQEIEVTRPVGALVLTQRCGVYGELPAFASLDTFPGYPRDLALASASTDTVGTSPDITPDENAPQQDDDPGFGSYPNPGSAVYPTECGLELGSAALVTDGALAGQYFTADGRLNQVTVVDTRDVDNGWTINGTVDSVFDSGVDTFDGDYLGWQPVLTDDSDPSFAGGYDQSVTVGSAVEPGAGVDSGTGLTSPQVLASTSANSGLGIAVLDARIQLLIPAEAPAGDYNATLALTAV